MAQTANDIKPTYSEEDIFLMIELQFGNPVPDKSPRTPGGRMHTASDYYNDVTDFLLSLIPDDLPYLIVLRDRFYRRHGIMLMDWLDKDSRRR